MTTNLPDLHLKIAAQLLPKETASDALRAVLRLPSMIRFYGARMALFLAGALQAQEAAMRKMSLVGLDATLDEYRKMRDLLALRPAVTERTHHAVVRQVTVVLTPGQAAPMGSIGSYDDLISRARRIASSRRTTATRCI